MLVAPAVKRPIKPTNNLNILGWKITPDLTFFVDKEKAENTADQPKCHFLFFACHMPDLAVQWPDRMWYGDMTEAELTQNVNMYYVWPDCITQPDDLIKNSKHHFINVADTSLILFTGLWG